MYIRVDHIIDDLAMTADRAITVDIDSVCLKNAVYIETNVYGVQVIKKPAKGKQNNNLKKRC